MIPLPSFRDHLPPAAIQDHYAEDFDSGQISGAFSSLEQGMAEFVQSVFENDLVVSFSSYSIFFCWSPPLRGLCTVPFTGGGGVPQAKVDALRRVSDKILMLCHQVSSSVRSFLMFK